MGSPTAWDFSIVAASGLTQKEFAALVRVARVTVVHWMQGRNQPSRHIAPRLTQVLKRLSAAVEAGTLPPQTPRLINTADPEQTARRMQEIANALR